MTPMKLSALDTIDNSYSCGGSQKKIKLRHTEKDYAAAFDLGVINAVLDLECDLDSEYYDDHHGKDENINSANIMISSYDFKENKRSDLVRNKCEKAVDKSSILKSSVTKNNTKIERDYDDDYNNYVASVRKYINYLNTMEDDEEQTYAVRAKLFEFVRGYDYNFNVLSSHLFPSNQVNGPARWTLRGVGPVRFLRHLEEGITYGTVRMTMYHEGTLQTLMDHLVEPGLEVGLNYHYNVHTIFVSFRSQHSLFTKPTGDFNKRQKRTTTIHVDYRRYRFRIYPKDICTSFFE